MYKVWGRQIYVLHKYACTGTYNVRLNKIGTELLISATCLPVQYTYVSLPKWLQIERMLTSLRLPLFPTRFLLLFSRVNSHAIIHSIFFHIIPNNTHPSWQFVFYSFYQSLLFTYVSFLLITCKAKQCWLVNRQNKQTKFFLIYLINQMLDSL